MWGLISTAFLGVYCLMSVYIGRRGWMIVGKSMTNSRIIYWIFLGLLILTFPIAEVAQDWLP